MLRTQEIKLNLLLSSLTFRGSMDRGKREWKRSEGRWGDYAKGKGGNFFSGRLESFFRSLKFFFRRLQSFYFSKNCDFLESFCFRVFPRKIKTCSALGQYRMVPLPKNLLILIRKERNVQLQTERNFLPFKQLGLGK